MIVRFWPELKLIQINKSKPLAFFDQAIKNCPNHCYELNPDKEQTLMMELKGGKILPFRLLSDGARNMLAMVADIAFRCTLLNPKLGEAAAIKTSGVVLIDELDLHLHPSWQKQTVHHSLFYHLGTASNRKNLADETNTSRDFQAISRFHCL